MSVGGGIVASGGLRGTVVAGFVGVMVTGGNVVAGGVAVGFVGKTVGGFKTS